MPQKLLHFNSIRKYTAVIGYCVALVAFNLFNHNVCFGQGSKALSQSQKADATFDLSLEPVDSGKMYQTQIWKVRVLFDMALKAVTADSTIITQQRTIDFQEEEIRRSLKLQQDSDSLAAVRATNQATSDEIISDLKKKVQVQEGLTENEKQAKKGWKLAAIGLVVLQVIELGLLIL